MMVELTEHELQYLAEVLETAHRELLQELHYTATVDYKELLRQRAELNEQLVAKLREVAVAA